MPPPATAELPLKVLLLTSKFTSPSSATLKMAPPASAELPLSVLFMISPPALPLEYPILQMAPPAPAEALAELPLIVQLLIWRSALLPSCQATLQMPAPASSAEFPLTTLLLISRLEFPASAPL